MEKDIFIPSLFFNDCNNLFLGFFPQNLPFFLKKKNKKIIKKD